MTRALRIADELDVGVLFVQETRLTAMNVSANKSAARKKGWKLTERAFRQKQDGRACGIVAVMSRWTASKVNLPNIPEDATSPIADVGERHIAMRIYRPDEEPLLVVGNYLKRGDPALATAQGSRIGARMAAYGGPRVMIGDWNATPDLAPAIRCTATGALHSCDDAVGHKPAPTREGGRCIDYAVATSTAIPVERKQCVGSADHNAVAYRWDTSKSDSSLQDRNAPPSSRES